MMMHNVCGLREASGERVAADLQYRNGTRLLEATGFRDGTRFELMAAELSGFDRTGYLHYTFR